MPVPVKRDPNHQILTGVLERIIFFNEENHFCIGEFRRSESSETITIKGILGGVQCGETLELTGHWVNHPLHGEQFKILSYSSTLPSSVYGIRKYLGSGLVPGIGKVYANKIVDHFGEDTLKIISEESARLREVPGIGAHRANAIKQAWRSQQAVREVVIFLQTYGVSVSHCLRLVKKYGTAARQIIQLNPYTIAREIEGIGFKTADRIAINLGIANDSPQRIDAGILYALHTLEDKGHSGYPINEFNGFAAGLLEAQPETVAPRLQHLIETAALAPGGDLVQFPTTRDAESTIAHAVARILAQPSRHPKIRIEVAIDWAQSKAGFRFGSEQMKAIRIALTEKISIITGGPGTGKTTILRAILQILRAKRVKVLMASPTGRAAQRMAEATGGSAQTIHRLLKFDPAAGKFTIHERSPLSVDTLIVDEASMLDCRLAAAFFCAIPSAAHLILVGDVNQLPSVGAGNVLRDLISSGRIAVTRLERIFRQEEQSEIVEVAHQILHGNASPPYPKDGLARDSAPWDLHFLRATSPEQCLDLIKEICRDYIPRVFNSDPVRDVQVVAPIHKGIAGITNLNRELQATLNPVGGARELNLGRSRFRVGDKVLQTRNNYDKGIFNGDLGIILHVDRETGSLTVEFDGEPIEFDRFELSDLQLAYAISVHKSQGSEFPTVIIPLLKQHYMMLQRNLLYTAISRGKKKVLIVGDPAAYAIAVRNKESIARHTDLKRRIQTLLPPRHALPNRSHAL